MKKFLTIVSIVCMSISMFCLYWVVSSKERTTTGTHINCGESEEETTVLDVTDSGYWYSWLLNDYDIRTRIAGDNDAKSILRWMPFELANGHLDETNQVYITEATFGNYGIKYYVEVSTADKKVSVEDISTARFHIDKKVTEPITDELLQKLKTYGIVLITYNSAGDLVVVNDSMRYSLIDYYESAIIPDDYGDPTYNFYIDQRGMEVCEGFDVTSEYFEVYTDLVMGDEIPNINESTFFKIVDESGMGTIQPFELIERFRSEQLPEVTGESLTLVDKFNDDFGNRCYVLGESNILLKVLPYVCYEVSIAPENWREIYGRESE